MKNDARLPPSIVKDSDMCSELEKMIEAILHWHKTHTDKADADWHLQCRTGWRLHEFQFILNALIEIGGIRAFAPRRSDWYFFKLMDAVEFPNFENTQDFSKSGPKLEWRNKDLENTCNATEVIEGFAILAAAGEYEKEKRAPITVDPETPKERRQFASGRLSLFACCEYHEFEPFKVVTDHGITSYLILSLSSDFGWCRLFCCITLHLVYVLVQGRIVAKPI